MILMQDTVFLLILVLLEKKIMGKVHVLLNALMDTKMMEQETDVLEIQVLVHSVTKMMEVE